MAPAVQVRPPLKPTLEVGDVVVTMSYPGIFTVAAILGDQATLSDADGKTIVVASANVRKVRGGSSDRP